MFKLSVLLLVASASAQIPSLGWCPDYQPMANFNINRFLGSWFEAERYFTVSELGTRCVRTKYESTPEGRILVSNEITNSLTGMKRVMEGSMQLIGREGEGRMIIKYSAVPAPYDNEYSILDTDYENYAVMYACSGIGPVHIQNAWILTRERLATPMVMQMAYTVLDRYKISRAFFVKTNQADCYILPSPVADPLDIKSDVIVDAKNVPIEVSIEEKAPMPEKKEDPAPQSENIQERAGEMDISAEEKPMSMPEKMLDKMSEKMPEKMSEKMSEKMPEKMSEKMPEKMSEKMPEKMADKMPEKMADKMPEMKDEQMKVSEEMKEKLEEKKEIKEKRTL